MGTTFDQIEDLALVIISDYKLDKLYTQNPNNFKSVCDSFLLQAIPHFTECRQSLSYNLTNRTFNNELSELEIAILADFWCLAWWDRKTQDAKQIELKLGTSGGFETHSESQNLKEKSNHADKVREKVYQRITDYQLQDKNIYNFLI